MMQLADEKGVLKLLTPEWSEPLFNPMRYKGAWGGRMGGKSHLFAEMMLEDMVIDQNIPSVCLRETQKSLKYSVKRLLENKIAELDLYDYFEIQAECIKCKTIGSTGIIIFTGMQDHTADSIKSLEGFKRAWFEEAQSASQRSLDLLIPTIIRTVGAELWFSWNPGDENAPIENLLRGKNPVKNSIVVKCLYTDNPFLTDDLKQEIESEKVRNPDKFRHIYGGEFIDHADALVFKNWTVEEFETPKDARFRLGADWGFSVDPTTLVRSYKVGRKLYVDYEAYQVGCEIEDTPNLFMTVPESEKWPIVADSSRPETISHIRKHGFPKILKSVKGDGSLEDGISFLQSCDIYVHPRCKNVIDELSTYKYKVDEKDIDPLTGKARILNELEDKKNHVIDALRYAYEADRRLEKVNNQNQQVTPLPVKTTWR